jgi:hypothetical protein
VKLLVGILFALGLTGVAYAAAAQLIVNGGALQSGSAENLVCDEDGVSLSYTLDNENNVTSATVSDIDPTCVGAGLTMVIHTASSEEDGAALTSLEDEETALVANDCDPKEITGDETAADPVECVLDPATSAESIEKIDISIVSMTEEPTGTPEPSVTPSETPTGTPTGTPEPTETPTGTPEPTETPTETPTGTPEPTETPTEEPTETPTQAVS